MKIFENIISFIKRIFVPQKKLNSEAYENTISNKKENSFVDSMIKENKEYYNKRSILDEIQKNPSLIDTLSYTRLVQLNSLYEERINEIKMIISQKS